MSTKFAMYCTVYNWEHEKCLLYRVAKCLVFRGSNNIILKSMEKQSGLSKLSLYRGCLLLRGVH